MARPVESSQQDSPFSVEIMFKKALGFSIPILIAVATFAALFPPLSHDPVFAPVLASCNGASTGTILPPPFISLHPALDGLLCTITSLFTFVSRTPEGRIFTVYFITAFAVPFLVFLAVESLRDSAFGSVRWFSLVFLLSQCVGISVVFPLFWLTSFALHPTSPGRGLTKQVYLLSSWLRVNC
jgi:hypothetical protein